MSLLRHLSIKQSYLIIFFILGFWALFSYMTMHGVIVQQQKYANLINVSGKQRMLSQRTALTAYTYFHTKETAAFNDLSNLTLLMEQEHNFLIQQITENTLREIYFGQPRLDQKVKDYILLLTLYSEKPTADKLEKVLHTSDALLPLLNDAVKIYEIESDAKIDALQQRELLILAGTFITLLLEYFILVLPIAKMISRRTYALESNVHTKTKALQQLFQEAQTSLDLVDAIVQNAPIPIFYKNLQGVYVKVNSAFCETFGFEPDAISNKTVRQIVTNDFAKMCDNYDRKLLEDPLHQQVYEYSVHNQKSGQTIEAIFYKKALMNDKGDVLGIVGAILDVTDKKAHERTLALRNAQLKTASETDPLTGVGNRRLCEETLQFQLQLQQESGITLTILMIDLDDFKRINDTYGHNGGDEVLQIFASTARGLIRENDFIGRWGGEEFMVICPASNEHDGLVVANKICDTVREIGFSFHTTISVSIGIAESTPEDESSEHLVGKSDKALYQAKHSGKDQAIAFSMLT